MERDAYLEHLTRDGARMAEIARGDLDATVPTCPEWTLRDLVEHTGFVHRWQTAAVRDRPENFPAEETFRFPPAPDESWSDWFQAGVDDAVRVMGACEPGEARWTWFAPDQTAGFYHRRITQETAVHRVDAELAATGTATPIDPTLAVDGIDEMFDVFVPASGSSPVGGSGETVLLCPVDATARWVVTLAPTTVTVVRAEGAVDAELRASASDLLLYVWGRDPLGPVDATGDQAATARFFAACKL